MSRAFQIIGLVAVVAVATAWLVQDLDWTTVRATLASARTGPLLGVLALLGVNHVARSLRLQPLVDAPVSAWDLLRISAVGFLAVQVLPLRLGELVRPQLLTRHGVPFGEGLGAIAVDRVLDVGMLLVLMGVVAAVVPLPAGAIEVRGVDVVAVGQRASALAVLVALVGLGGIAVAGPRIRDRLEPVPAVGPWLARLVDGLAGGLRRLGGDPAGALVAFGWTLLSWLSTLALLWLAQQSFAGIPTSLASTLVLWTAIVTAMSTLPTPGFFGPFEAAGVAALALFGATGPPVKAFVLVLHVILFAFAVGLAVLSMLTMRLSLADLGLTGPPGVSDDPAQSTPR